MDFETVYEAICDGMAESIRQELTINPISFSMKPSKTRPEGLGISAENTWWLHLLVLQNQYLPQNEPYITPQFSPAIASATYGKELADGCYDLTNFVLGD